jgi:hypothetical protein
VPVLGSFGAHPPAVGQKPDHRYEIRFLSPVDSTTGYLLSEPTESMPPSGSVLPPIREGYRREESLSHASPWQYRSVGSFYSPSSSTERTSRSRAGGKSQRVFSSSSRQRFHLTTR